MARQKPKNTKEKNNKGMETVVFEMPTPKTKSPTNKLAHRKQKKIVCQPTPEFLVQVSTSNLWMFSPAIFVPGSFSLSLYQRFKVPGMLAKLQADSENLYEDRPIAGGCRAAAQHTREQMQVTGESR